MPTKGVQKWKYLQALGNVLPFRDVFTSFFFETSVEIFTRVLVKYLVPRDEIEKFIAEVRAGEYEIFPSLSKGSAALSDLKRHLPDVDICTLRVDDTSVVVGKSLAQIGLRQKYGVTLLAIRRDSQILSNLRGDAKICADDLLLVLGQTDEIPRPRAYSEIHKKESQFRESNISGNDQIDFAP